MRTSARAWFDKVPATHAFDDSQFGSLYLRDYNIALPLLVPDFLATTTTWGKIRNKKRREGQKGDLLGSVVAGRGGQNRPLGQRREERSVQKEARGNHHEGDRDEGRTGP